MALLYTDCPDLKLVTRGKVRDIYEVPGHVDKLLFVATDRVSAFDIIMKNGIPNKGRLLTSLSLFFFHFLSDVEKIIPNHVITADLDSPDIPEVVRKYRGQLEGRSILVKRCEVIKCEAIVRGYLTGSAYVEYKKKGTVHGLEVPKDMKESAKFPETLFTPSTKADAGEHDENIHPDELADILGPELTSFIATTAVQLYTSAASHSRLAGLILADTKFEFGLDHSRSPPALTLVDECLTPDSSRFWLASEWAEGKTMTGFDKQVLREWLKGGGGGFQGSKKREGVEIPEDVVRRIWQGYTEAYKLLTGKEFKA